MPDTDNSSNTNSSSSNNASVYANMMNIPLVVTDGDDIPMQNLMEFDIWENLDESYPPDTGTSNPYTNYNGSILQMIKDVSSQPFNEMFWTNVRGIPTFVYRPTPFDPENWKGLTVNTIPTETITDISIENSDSEQSAVFKITPTQNLGDTTYSGGINANLYPLTNLDLVKRYGYKLMEANTDYFNGQTLELDSQSYTPGTSAADSEAMKGYTDKTAQLHHPPYTSIVDAFYLTSGRKDSNGNLSIPKEYGGTTAYNAVINALKDSNSNVAFFNSISNYGVTKEQANSLWLSKNSMSTTKYLSIIAPNYVPTTTNLASNSTYLKSYTAMKNNPKKAASELIGLLGYSIGSKQAYEMVEYAINNGGTISESAYKQILSQYKITDTEDGVSGSPMNGNDSVNFFFARYSEKLFNWYADNAKFYSGTITFSGFESERNTFKSTNFIGTRIYFYDRANGVYWEFYCEGEQYSFDLTNGLSITLTITRGVPLGDDITNTNKRFSNEWSYWGTFTNFVGGYFGEQTLAAAIENASQSSSGSSSSSGSESDSDIISFAKKVEGKHWIYSEKNRTDFGDIGKPKEGGHADCSSFVWYVLKSCGYNTSSTAWTTFTMEPYLDKKNDSDTKAGDIVISNSNPHAGILLETWKGAKTKIINCGGDSNTVVEGSYQTEFGNSYPNVGFFRAKK